jgi:Flp pilus assembly pilin Flp
MFRCMTAGIGMALRDQRAASAIELALMMSMTGLVLISAFGALGSRIVSLVEAAVP